MANPLSAPPIHYIELEDEVVGGGVVADLLAEDDAGGGGWGRGGFWGFPQLFFDPRQIGIEFTDADSADSLTFGRRGVVLAAGAGITSLCDDSIIVTDANGNRVCPSLYGDGKGFVDSPFLRQVSVIVQAAIGRNIPVKRTYEVLRGNDDGRFSGNYVQILYPWSDLFSGYRRPASSTVIVSVAYENGAAAPVTATVHSPVTLDIVLPTEEDLPDFSATGLDIGIIEDGMWIFIPGNNRLKFGERRTLAFNIPIYEQQSCAQLGRQETLHCLRDRAPKKIRFFWDVRFVVGHGREFFGAFTGEAPINGLVPPVADGVFVFPASGEEFSIDELPLFGKAGLPKNIPVTEGANSSWSVVSGGNLIGGAGQSFTPGRLVGADGAVSERLTLSGSTTLKLPAPGVYAILDLVNHDTPAQTVPAIFVKVSANLQRVAEPARGRFHLTLYSRPEQIAGRDTPEAIVHFYYDIVAPGRIRGGISVRTESGPWESDAVSDAPVAVGPVFTGKPDQEIDPPTGPILEYLADYHVTVYVDNTGETPTFQFGRLPSADSLHFGLPDNITLRLTVWEEPRGRLPEEIWEFSNIGFPRSSAAMARNLADAIDSGSAREVVAVMTNLRHNLGASSISTTVNTAVDGVLPLHRAMSLAVPPARPSGEDRAGRGELRISTSPAAVEMVSILLDAGAADPLAESRTPNQSVLDRFIASRIYGGHWTVIAHADVKLAAFTKVAQRIRDLGGVCANNQGGGDILNLCSLTPNP